MPEVPAQSEAQNASEVDPIGVSNPIPVNTARRTGIGFSWAKIDFDIQ